MHGFNHVAAPRRHFGERLLWALVIAAAIWGAVDISLGQWQRYNENPTVVTLEKDFRTWRYSVPAVTACYSDRVRATRLPEVIARYWNATPADEKYSYYAKFVSTVANSDILNLTGFVEFKDDESLNVDMYALAYDVIPESQVKTTWPKVGDGDPEWTPVMTEAGACHATNSLAIQDTAIVPPNSNETKKLPVTCKFSSFTCAVMFEVSKDCDFYIHSPYDIMDITLPAKHVEMALSRKTSISVSETRCGKGVEELSPSRRDCRYTSEPEGGGRQIFSTNTCRLTCRSKLAVKLCGCKPFYYTFEDGPTCSPAGMACLSAHKFLLINNAGRRCPCAQQCVDAIFKEVTTEDQRWPKGTFGNVGSVRYVVQPPRIRYTREIVFYFQDLIVSFGGAAGLFLGASFISFVEIFYFVLVRVLKVCLGDPADKGDGVIPAKQQLKPYEASRLKELTTILEGQKRYEQRTQLYY